MSLTRTRNITSKNAQPGDMLEIDDGRIGPTQLRVVRVGPKTVELESDWGGRKRTMSRADFDDWAAGRYPGDTLIIEKRRKAARRKARRSSGNPGTSRKK